MFYLKGPREKMKFGTETDEETLSFLPLVTVLTGGLY